MTAIRMVYLDCDGEGCVATTSASTHGTVADARHFATLDGWGHKAGRDLCPWCLAGIGPYRHGDEHVRPPGVFDA